MKFLLPFLIFFITSLNASFVLKNDSLVIDKAVDKIEEMSQELHDKTGIGVYLVAVEKLPEGVGVTEEAKTIATDLKAPYALIVFSSSDKQIDLITSKDLEGKLDKDEILDTYIIKILVSHNKNVTEEQKYSAALLNGIAEATDRLAETKGIVLDSSIGSESKETYDIIALIVKIMLLITVLAIGRIWYYRER